MLARGRQLLAAAAAAARRVWTAPSAVTAAPRWWAYVGLGALFFAVYASGASAEAGFGAAARFALNCLGAAEAEGFGLHGWLCRPFAALPGASSAYGTALFSALCAAVAVALLARLAYEMTADAVTAFGAAALLGVSRGFWEAAGAPGGVALLALLVLGVWWLLLRARGGAWRWLGALGLGALPLLFWWLWGAMFLPEATEAAGAATWHDGAAYAVILARRVFVDEAGAAAGALMAAGFLAQWRWIGAARAAGLTLLFLGETVLLLVLLQSTYDEAGAEAVGQFAVLGLAAGCVWAALGAGLLCGRWRAAALMLAAGYALTVNWVALEERRARDGMAAAIVELHWQKLPAGGFAPHAGLLPLLAYSRAADGARPDITLLTAQEASVAPRGQPLCHSGGVEVSTARAAQEYLLFSCLREARDISFVNDDQIIAFLRRAAAHYEAHEDWTARRLTGYLIGDATRALMRVRARHPLPPGLGELLEDLSVTPAGQLALLEYLVAQPEFALSAARADLFERAAKQNLPKLERHRRARLLRALAKSFEAVWPPSDAAQESARRYYGMAAEVTGG